MDLGEQIRSYWNEDAGTYDSDPGHHPTAPLELAAWRAALESLLPTAPARVLDVGAGTGFLSLLVAGLGHQVTAVDLSSGMLGRLREKADQQGLAVEAVEADAAAVPTGPFDAVISRHLLWTLPDPGAALRAWRSSVPEGRLVLVETLWSDSELRSRVSGWAAKQLARARHVPPAHHASYGPELLLSLPLSSGTSPDALLQMIGSAGWRAPRVHRLRDLEWAAARGLPWPERDLPRPPRYALVAS